MSYSNQSFKQLRFGVGVIYQQLTETGKGVNGTSEFLLQFFPHCVSSHSSVDATPWVYPRGSRQDSGRTLKHRITQGQCYSISKSSLVLPISLKKKVSGGSMSSAPIDFFSCGFLIWLWYQGSADLKKCLGVSLSSQFYGRL